MIFPIVLSIILVLVLIYSISVMMKKRRKAGITGIKTALTSICLYAVAVVNLLAYWLGFLGIISWAITIILIILAAYFTKYIPVSEDRK